MPTADKKTLLSLAIALAIHSHSAGAASAWDIDQSRPQDQVRLDVELSEGTWMNLDVSPDGKSIVFDLLGHIYEVSSSGGEAKALTSGRSVNLLPRYSPDGQRIAFSSDRDGVENLWVLERSSGKLTNATQSTQRVVSGAWSADGRFLYGTVSDEPALTVTPYMFDMRGGRQQLMEGTQIFVPINNFRDVSARGAVFFEHLDRAMASSGGRIKVYDKRTGEVAPYVERPGGAVSPAVSPNGRYLAYVHREDVETQLILHDLDTRQERVLARGLDRDRQDDANLLGAYPTMSWMPDSKTVVFWNKGGIQALDISTGQQRQIPFKARVQRSLDPTIRFPVAVPDTQARSRIHRWGQRTSKGIVYETLGDIYLKTGNETRNLTSSEAHETSPLYDEASGTLYYASWTDDDLGAVYQRKLSGGTPRKLTNKPAQYGALELSPDGTKLAFLRGDARIQNGQRLERQTHFELALLDLKSGSEQAVVSDILWDLTGNMQRSWGSGVLQVETPSVRFSADGKQLYYSEQNEKGTVLNRIAVDGRDRTELYRFPDGSRADISPDGQWISYQEHLRNYLTPFSYIGKVITVSANAGIGTSIRVEARHDGLYPRWSRDSRELMWTRGPQFVEKKVADILSGGTTVVSTDVSVTFPVSVPKNTIALQGARVITIDPQRRVLENATVLIRDGRIAQLGTNVDIPKDAKVFDVTGRTIMPGIIDAHAHLKDTTSAIIKMPALGVVEQESAVLRSNLAYGVTTLYEVFGDVVKDFWMSDMVLKGAMPGPRLYSVGNGLYGSHNFMQHNYRVMRTYEDALEQVRFNKDFGATALKDYLTSGRRIRQQIATAARAEGLNVVIEPFFEGHANLSRLVDGATELAHAAGFTSVYDDYLKMFAATDIGITYTFGGPEYVIEHTQERLWDDPKLNQFARADELRARMRRGMRQAEDEQGLIKTAANLKKLHDAGVLIEVGGHGELLGLDIHHELEVFVTHGGFKPMEAIAVATINNARSEGLDRDLGSLEIGKRADLIILEGNPLEDIRSTRQIDMVMKNGELYNGADAARVFPNPEPAPKFYFKRSE